MKLSPEQKCRIAAFMDLYPQVTQSDMAGLLDVSRTTITTIAGNFSVVDHTSFRNYVLDTLRNRLDEQNRSRGFAIVGTTSEEDKPLPDDNIMSDNFEEETP